MADHLRLAGAIPLPSKRVVVNYDPDAEGPDPRVQATTLRGLLEGLESARPGIFGGTFVPPQQTDDDEPDAADLGEIVLKVSGAAAFPAGAFKAWSMTPVAVGENKQFYVLSDSAARAAFAEFAAAYVDAPDESVGVKAWRELLKNIVGIDLYDSEDRLAPGLRAPEGEEVADVDIALWPTSVATQGAVAEGRRRVAVLVDLIEAMAEEDRRVQVLAKDDENPDTLLLHARVDAATFDAILNHPYVERVRGPVAVEVTVSDLSDASEPDNPLLPEGAPIGVIDDLVVDANPWLTDVVVEQKSFPDGFVFGDHTAHGTQVAGIAAWGNIRQLLTAGFDGQPHPLYVARVAQMNDRYDTQIVGNAADQISDALDWLASCGVKIVVLSLGENHPDDGAIPSDLSSLVDRKALELDLVIVTSAGNLTEIDGHWKADYPAYLREEGAKIAAPGSAALAVTVGSIAHTTGFDRARVPNGIHIAGTGEAAPYTRTGPSRGANGAGRQKPEFAAHGGSWVFDQPTENLIMDDANMAATTLIPPVNARYFGASTGTSYAAPRVAHEIARIQTRYPESSANLLRALTALSGSRPPRGMPQRNDVLSGIYGIPVADRVLESGNNQVVFVYEGEMLTNSHTVLEIPIPREFAAGVSERELRIALAFNPPVRRSRRDYIAGRMRFEFIQRESLTDIRDAFARQPTRAERDADPMLPAFDPLPGRELDPPKTRLSADTLICRTYHSPREGWNEDDRDYHLVITHDHSPWSQAQKNSYTSQPFAVAIHMLDLTRTDVDLYALAQARLQARARSQGGI